MKYASLYERLIANSVKPDDQNENGCWVWTGPTRRHAGGHRTAVCIRIGGKPLQHNAARIMIDQFEGFTDPAHGASHLCDGNWLCINPDHLVGESHKDNIGRRDGKPIPLPKTRELVNIDPDLYVGVISLECPF